MMANETPQKKKHKPQQPQLQHTEESNSFGTGTDALPFHADKHNQITFTPISQPDKPMNGNMADGGHGKLILGGPYTPEEVDKSIHDTIPTQKRYAAPPEPNEEEHLRSTYCYNNTLYCLYVVLILWSALLSFHMIHLDDSIKVLEVKVNGLVQHEQEFHTEMAIETTDMINNMRSLIIMQDKYDDIQDIVQFLSAHNISIHQFAAVFIQSSAEQESKIKYTSEQVNSVEYTVHSAGMVPM